MMMMSISIVLSILLTPLFLLSYSFVGDLSLLLMFSRVLRTRGLLSLGGMLLLGFWDAVCRHGPCGPLSSLHPWDSGVPPDLHGFYKWVFDSLELLNGFLDRLLSLVGMFGSVSGLGGSGRM